MACLEDPKKLPLTLLSVLKQDTIRGIADKSKEKRLSNVKLPPLTVVTTAAQDSSPGNVWYHHKQRQRLKYLTDSTQCVCGAGRDISFLYDASDSSITSIPKANVPGSLIPDEFHVVKHSGVLGLELYDETYSTITASHDRHHTAFPSMQPSGRQEVLELKSTLDQMIGSIGLARFVKEMDLRGPTHVHNLIQLIKKEQEIYNICFHELIRQVTVHCAERGELLAEIRQCYCNLLSKIPYQVKSLHDEVVAQRALDRKLTTELIRFHGLLSKLTCELCELRDQNELAGEEIDETKENLLIALSESEKNANLLVEYSQLYELQRSRLESQIAHLSKEKELWEQTCYHLASEVADHHHLESVRQLQLSGKSWVQLTNHFAIMLSDKNTKQLCLVQNDAQKWRRDLAGYLQELKDIEQKIISKLMAIYDDMNLWSMKLKTLRQSNNTSAMAERTQMEQFWQSLLYWLKVLNELSDIFSGEKQLNRVDKLQDLKDGMSQWSEVAQEIIQRHLNTPHVLEEGLDHHQPEPVTSIVNSIDVSMEALSRRTSGDNGVAVTFVRLITPMESWDTTFNLMLHGGKYLNDSSCTKLMSQLDMWLTHVSVALENLSSQNNQISFDNILTEVDKWCSVFCHDVQVRDNHVIQQVAQLYSSIMQWIAQLLLVLINSNSHIQTLSELESNCALLCDNLSTFTNEIAKSCISMISGKDHSSEFSEIMVEEKSQLQMLQDEAKNWTRLSLILMEFLSTDKETESLKKPAPMNKQDTSIMTIGVDDNVTVAPLMVEYEDTNSVDLDLDLHTEQGLPEGREIGQQEVEKLVIAMDELKLKLSTMEVKATSEQQRADTAQRLLKDAENHIDQLTKELKQTKDEVQEHIISKKGRKGAKTKPKDSRS